MKKIKFIQGDIEIMGFGKTEAGKTVNVPDELAKSLIENSMGWTAYTLILSPSYKAISIN